MHVRAFDWPNPFNIEGIILTHDKNHSWSRTCCVNYRMMSLKQTLLGSYSCKAEHCQGRHLAAWLVGHMIFVLVLCQQSANEGLTHTIQVCEISSTRSEAITRSNRIIRFDSIDQVYDNALCSNTICRASVRGQNHPHRGD